MLSDLLVALGAGDREEAACASLGLGELVGRVVRVDRGAATVLTDDGVIRLDDAGGEPQVVGDWIARGEDGLSRLPRRTELARRGGPRKDERQAVASGVDLVLLVHAAAAVFRPQLLSTFLVMAYDAGAEPLVVLSKADLVDDAPRRCADASRRLGGVDVLAISSRTGEGLEALSARLANRTAVLLGESGAGKSTLINHLSNGAELATQEVSRGGQGRHTTTHRELVLLTGGGVLIDTPGVREAASFSGPLGVARAFHDVVEVAERCRFGDCRHKGEPGCAVAVALKAGTLDPERLEAFRVEVASQFDPATRPEVSGRGRRRPSAPPPEDDEDD